MATIGRSKGDAYTDYYQPKSQRLSHLYSSRESSLTKDATSPNLTNGLGPNLQTTVFLR